MTIKVGTKLLQLIEQMKQEVELASEHATISHGYISIGLNPAKMPRGPFFELDREEGVRVIQSLLDAGFETKKIEKSYGRVGHWLSLKDLSLNIRVDYQATEQDELDGLLEKQKEIQDKIELLTRKGTDFERSAV